MWGTRVNDFASEWVKQGHEVVVVTSIYSKSDLRTDKFVEDQKIDGISVKILNILIDNKRPFLRRIWTFIQYAVVSSWYALTLPADVVVASSGPITVGIPGLVARYLRGRKLVFETRDLWPDGAIELGILRNRWIKRLAYWFEKRCYKASSLIVALSPGMQKHIQQKHKCPHVICITNTADVSLFAADSPFDGRGVLLPGKYAIYTGNIGEVNNSRLLLDAARILRERKRSEIIILLIGDGQQKESLVKQATDEEVINFIHWGLMPKMSMVPLVKNALASLVPLKGIPILDTSSPNKLFDSFAAGVPVIQTTRGWIKELIEKEQCGINVEPDDAEGLAKAIIFIADYPEERDRMAANAKRLAETQFNRDILAGKYLEALLGLAQG
jgi:glycosyltransferase involved in cell wall biosynthesis